MRHPMATAAYCWGCRYGGAFLGSPKPALSAFLGSLPGPATGQRARALHGFSARQAVPRRPNQLNGAEARVKVSRF